MENREKRRWLQNGSAGLVLERRKKLLEFGGSASISNSVSRFAEQAEEIFRAAESAGSTSDLTILLGDNGIRMIADSDWPLDSLLWHHGAKTAYRVTERSGTVRVEGRQGGMRCVVESARPAQIARLLLG